MEGKFKQMKLDEGMIVKTRNCNELYRISLRLNNTVLIPICYCIELHMDPDHGENKLIKKYIKQEFLKL